MMSSPLVKTEPEDLPDDAEELPTINPAVLSCETEIIEMEVAPSASKSDKNYKCPACGKGYISLSNYNIHMRLHTGLDAFKCDRCSKLFSQEHLLKRHKCLFSEDVDATCASCGKECKISVEKLVDVKTGKSLVFNCEDCGEPPLRGGSPVDLDPSKEVRIQCEDCKGIFRSETSFLAHAKLHRAQKRVPRCDVCAKVFPSFSKMRGHYSTHIAAEESPQVSSASKIPFQKEYHKCTKCWKAFGSPSRLQRHLIMHSDERNFKCEFCAKTFKYQQTFDWHVKRHTKEGRMYVCDKCDKTFPQSNELKRHVLTHSSGQNFRCDLCQKMFKHQLTLSLHMRRHRINDAKKPVKKYPPARKESNIPCPYCQKKFKYQGRVDRHVKCFHQDQVATFEKVFVKQEVDYDYEPEETE